MRTPHSPQRFGYFAGDRSGNVAIITAIVLSVASFVGIAALDVSGIERARAALQDASDIAVLAAAASPSNAPIAKVRAAAEKLVRANIGSAGALKRLSVELNPIEDGYAITTRGVYDTVVTDIFGGHDTWVWSKAQAVSRRRGLEFVFVLDATNSMNYDSRWRTAMTALETMLTRLEGAAASGEFFVSFLAFNDVIPIPAAKTAWLSGPVEPNWTGCVLPREQRLGGFDYALTDDGPGIVKFDQVLDGDTYPGGRELDCANGIVGPTSNIATIRSAISGVVRDGTGRFDEGLAWGWRLLSPQWRGEWGSIDYPAASGDRKKILVLVTDFNSTAYDYVMSGSAGGSFGWNNGTREAFEHFENLCERVKATEIELHIVQMPGNRFANPYAERCASSAQTLHRPTDATGLVAVFEGIQGSETTRLVR